MRFTCDLDKWPIEEHIFKYLTWTYLSDTCYVHRHPLLWSYRNTFRNPSPNLAPLRAFLFALPASEEGGYSYPSEYGVDMSQEINLNKVCPHNPGCLILTLVRDGTETPPGRLVSVESVWQMRWKSKGWFNQKPYWRNYLESIVRGERRCK